MTDSNDAVRAVVGDAVTPTVSGDDAAAAVVQWSDETVDALALGTRGGVAIEPFYRRHLEGSA
jgi:hypothetical protein